MALNHRSVGSIPTSRALLDVKIKAWLTRILRISEKLGDGTITRIRLSIGNERLRSDKQISLSYDPYAQSVSGVDLTIPPRSTFIMCVAKRNFHWLVEGLSRWEGSES